MIQINLSKEQADSLMRGLGWRDVEGEYCDANLREDVAAEVFKQLENQLLPAPTEAASLAVWRDESGYTAKAVEEWKRKNETAEEAGL